MGGCIGKQTKSDEFTIFVKQNINTEKIGKISTSIEKDFNNNKSLVQDADSTEAFFKRMMIIEALFKETPDYGCLGSDTFNDMTSNILEQFRESLKRACKNILKMPDHLIVIVIERFNKYSKAHKVGSKDVNVSIRKSKLMCLKYLADLQSSDMKKSDQFHNNGIYVFHDFESHNGLLNWILLYEGMFQSMPNYDKILPLKNKNKLTRSQFNLMMDLYKKNVRIAFPDISQDEYNLNIQNFSALEDILVARHMSSFI